MRYVKLGGQVFFGRSWVLTWEVTWANDGGDWGVVVRGSGGGGGGVPRLVAVGRWRWWESLVGRRRWISLAIWACSAVAPGSLWRGRSRRRL
jgi:hypothetical protein